MVKISQQQDISLSTLSSGEQERPSKLIPAFLLSVTLGGLTTSLVRRTLELITATNTQYIRERRGVCVGIALRPCASSELHRSLNFRPTIS